MTDWLHAQLIEQLIESHKNLKNTESNTNTSSYSNHYSLLPINDPIKLIDPSSLPITWLKRDPRSIPCAHINSVMNYFSTYFQSEMNLIKRYSI